MIVTLSRSAAKARGPKLYSDSDPLVCWMPFELWPPRSLALPQGDSPAAVPPFLLQLRQLAAGLGHGRLQLRIRLTPELDEPAVVLHRQVALAPPLVDLGLAEMRRR